MESNPIASEIDEAEVAVIAIRGEFAIYILIAIRARKGEEVIEGIILVVIKYAFGCVAECVFEYEDVGEDDETEIDKPFYIKRRERRK